MLESPMTNIKDYMKCVHTLSEVLNRAPSVPSPVTALNWQLIGQWPAGCFQCTELPRPFFQPASFILNLFVLENGRSSLLLHYFLVFSNKFYLILLVRRHLSRLTVLTVICLCICCNFCSFLLHFAPWILRFLPSHRPSMLLRWRPLHLLDHLLLPPAKARGQLSFASCQVASASCTVRWMHILFVGTAGLRVRTKAHVMSVRDGLKSRGLLLCAISARWKLNESVRRLIEQGNEPIP